MTNETRTTVGEPDHPCDSEDCNEVGFHCYHTVTTWETTPSAFGGTYERRTSEFERCCRCLKTLC